MKKKNKELRYDSTIPLFKMDDWSRRAFIKKAGIFLGAFGVPFLPRIETMSKLSKKLFGNSLAFAQGGPSHNLIDIRFRAGYPHPAFAGTLRDSQVSTLNRNFHAGSGTVINADAGNSMTLHVAPQAAALAGLDAAQATQDPPILAPNAANPTNYASRIASFRLENDQGHSNVMSTTRMTGAPDRFVAHAAQQDINSPRLLSNGVNVGAQNDADSSQTGGNTTGGNVPIYAGSISALTGIFSRFSMTPATGQTIAEELTTDVMAGVNQVDAQFLQVLEDQGRKGIDEVTASVNKLQELLNTDLSAALTPTAAHINAILGTTGGGDLTPNPGQKFSTPLGNTAAPLAEFFAFAALWFAQGAGSAAGLVVNTGDWHGNTCQSGGAGNSPTVANSGTIQGAHAAMWGQIIANLLKALDSNPLFVDANTGQQLGLNTTMIFDTEFGRTCLTQGNGTDNGDGDCKHCVMICPPGAIQGGTYGDRNDNNQFTSFDTATGASSTSTTLPDSSYAYGTVSEVLGITEEVNGVTSPDIITKITG